MLISCRVKKNQKIKLRLQPNLKERGDNTASDTSSPSISRLMCIHITPTPSTWQAREFARYIGTHSFKFDCLLVGDVLSLLLVLLIRIHPITSLNFPQEITSQRKFQFFLGKGGKLRRCTVLEEQRYQPC